MTSIPAIEEHGRTSTSHDHIATFDDFRSIEREELKRLSTGDPVLATAFQLIDERKDLLSDLNVAWTGVGCRPGLVAGYENGWRQTLPGYANVVLLDAFLKDDPRVVSLFTVDQLASIRVEIALLRQIADQEKFAELGKVAIMYGRTTPLSPFFAKLRDVAAHASHCVTVCSASVCFGASSPRHRSAHARGEGRRSPGSGPGPR